MLQYHTERPAEGSHHVDQLSGRLHHPRHRWQGCWVTQRASMDRSRSTYDHVRADWVAAIILEGIIATRDNITHGS